MDYKLYYVLIDDAPTRNYRYFLCCSLEHAISDMKMAYKINKSEIKVNILEGRQQLEECVSAIRTRNNFNNSKMENKPLPLDFLIDTEFPI